MITTIEEARTELAHQMMDVEFSLGKEPNERQFREVLNNVTELCTDEVAQELISRFPLTDND